MLILSRLIGETIVINGNIRITIKSIQGCEVKLAIHAPREIPVDRLEIHERKVAEKRAAAELPNA